MTNYQDRNDNDMAKRVQLIAEQLPAFFYDSLEQMKKTNDLYFNPWMWISLFFNILKQI